MSAMSHLQRRSSGVYVVRLVVPPWLRPVAGRTELHRSTGCRDLALAKIVAGEIISAWFRSLHRLRHMDITKVSAGSVDLLGDGTIPISAAADALGTTPHELGLRLVQARAPRFLFSVKGLACTLVDDIAQLNDTFDDRGNVVNVDLSPAALKRHGAPHHHTGEVLLAFNDEALEILGGTTAPDVSVFLLPGRITSGIVLDAPVAISSSQLLVRRRDVEALRTKLAELHADAVRTTVTADSPASANQLGELIAAQDSIAKSKYAKRKVSSLADHYLGVLRQRGLKPDELRRQADACSALVELTDDMLLGEIDREDIERAVQELAKVPRRRDLVERKAGRHLSWRELIEFGEATQPLRLTPASLTRLVEDMNAVFKHGVRERWLKTNPIAGFAGQVNERHGGKKVRDDERRDPFSPEDLHLIFSQRWFAMGVGAKTKDGLFHRYRPYHYWLPLLGLFVGGRINELSQLYINDVRRTESGNWYVDFNLEQHDKRDADEAEPDLTVSTAASIGSSGNDKSLKTINATRGVPLHPRLIELGLLEYLDALRGAGQLRLFPELRFNEAKGYGKEASAWFNERFLGKMLQIPRNGRKVFHSFRHNFATALERAETPDGMVCSTKRSNQRLAPEQLVLAE